jgi:hypothetical protein
VLGADAAPGVAQYAQLGYVTRCVCESMRLYPHPPVLLRRARVPDVLPGGYEARRGGGGEGGRGGGQGGRARFRGQGYGLRVANRLHLKAAARRAERLLRSNLRRLDPQPHTYTFKFTRTDAVKTGQTTTLSSRWSGART